MPLPDPIIEVLTVFRPLFPAPTWRKLMILLSGTLLARGRRTVAAALRASGNQQGPNWSLFHQVLNRARWAPLAVSRQLLLLIVETFVPAGACVDLVIDETNVPAVGQPDPQTRPLPRQCPRKPLPSAKKRVGSLSQWLSSCVAWQARVLSCLQDRVNQIQNTGLFWPHVPSYFPITANLLSPFLTLKRFGPFNPLEDKVLKAFQVRRSLVLRLQPVHQLILSLLGSHSAKFYLSSC